MKVIINRSDAIGDTLLTTPMALQIKEKFPHAHITFIISKRCKELLLNHPHIDDFWVLDDLDFSSLKEKLKSYTHYFYVGGSHLPGLAALMAGVPFRGGLKSRWPSFFLLNKGIRQKRSKVEMHEVNYNISLLSPLGIKGELVSRPVLKLKDSEVEKGISEAGLKGIEYIVIHPGMSGHTLNWPSQSYGELVEKLEETYPERFKYVVSFTPSDGPYLKGMRDYLAKRNLPVTFLDGAKLGLRLYMGALSKASLFVGPSTGPTHIANALGVKQIGIYSPIKVQSALRWAPFDVDGSRTRVATPDVKCEETIKCAGSTCSYFECMGTIKVSDLIAQIKELL